MDLREWLSAVALRNGSTPGNAKHYAGFAANVRRDFARLPCTDATAHAVASLLGGQFPTWDELRQAIRAVLTEHDGNERKTEDERMVDLWIGYYRRRLRDSPQAKDHLLSLLKRVCMPAFLAVDDGHTGRAADAFDDEFWRSRGGRKHYDPTDFFHAPAPQLHRMPSGPRGPTTTPARPAAPKRPQPHHLTGDALAAARARIGIDA